LHSPGDLDRGCPPIGSFAGFCDIGQRALLPKRNRLGYPKVSKGADPSMPQNTLTITDNRTGQVYTLPVDSGTIRAMNPALSRVSHRSPG